MAGEVVVGTDEAVGGRVGGGVEEGVDNVAVLCGRAQTNNHSDRRTTSNATHERGQVKLVIKRRFQPLHGF